MRVARRGRANEHLGRVDVVPRGDVGRGGALEHLVAPRAQVPRQLVEPPQSQMVCLEQDARRTDGRKGKLAEHGVVVALGVDHEQREAVAVTQARLELGRDAEAAHVRGLDVLGDHAVHAVAGHRPFEELRAQPALVWPVCKESIVALQVRAVERRNLRRPVARAFAVRHARLRARVGGEAARVAVVVAPVARRIRQVDRVHLQRRVAARVAHRRVDELEPRRSRRVVPLELGEDVRHGLEQRGGPPALDGQGRRVVLQVRGLPVDVGPDLQEGGRVRIEAPDPLGRQQAAHRCGRRAQRRPLPLPRLRDPERRVLHGIRRLLEPARLRPRCSERLAPGAAARPAETDRGEAQGEQRRGHAAVHAAHRSGSRAKRGLACARILRGRVTGSSAGSSGAGFPNPSRSRRARVARSLALCER